MNRESKVQVSKIVFYWAVLTVALAVFWSISLNALHLAGLGAAFSLVVPVLLGGLGSIGLYWRRDHQIIEYDNQGYCILKGSRKIENHVWSEFKECSIIRDSYGRARVRAYTERNGNHVDIDSSVCGIDPYAFRDFVTARIGSATVPDHKILSVDIFDGLEKEIQLGRASWIADLDETFRKYQLSGERFPLIARGGTRPKGFLMSRFLAVTVMPNYQVCLYASDINTSVGEAKSELMRLIRIIETQRDKDDIKWSWLLLFSDREPSTQVSRLIETFGNKDVGIGCIDVTTGQIITSPNQLGKSLSKQMRFDRLIRDLNKKRRVAA